MTEEEIKKARENYKELLLCAKEYYKIKDRIQELEIMLMFHLILYKIHLILSLALPQILMKLLYMVELEIDGLMSLVLFIED